MKYTLFWSASASNLGCFNCTAVLCMASVWLELSLTYLHVIMSYHNAQKPNSELFILKDTGLHIQQFGIGLNCPLLFVKVKLVTTNHKLNHHKQI